MWLASLSKRPLFGNLHTTTTAAAAAAEKKEPSKIWLDNVKSVCWLRLKGISDRGWELET